MLNLIIQLIRAVFIGLERFLALLVGYLLLLTGTAWLASARTLLPAGGPTQRFLILIPAHNEEELLPSLLQNLNKLDYPRSLYQVHVVADNCTDKTAELARQHGAVAHERTNHELRGKGYALQWLLQQISDAQTPHDAIVILDADSIVSENFLRVMDARLARGERAIQAYYAVRDPDRSRSVSLRYAALAVLHYLRPQGRMVLGGSAGLKGNGMVFKAELLRSHEWSASLTEDIEFHMGLVLAGERVTFAPDAIVWAEMPNTLEDSHTQNVRWERGRMEMIRHYVPQLMQQAWTRQSFVLFDAAMEQLIPPFSILAGGSLVSFVAALLLPDGNQKEDQKEDQNKNKGILNKSGVLLGLFLIAGQVIYLFAGLLLARAPKAVYVALLDAPRFVVWKILLYVRVLLGFDQDGWVRTKRNTEAEHEAG